jgi:Na+/H+ antiporter NhaD/arsenite permease-like protein
MTRTNIRPFLHSENTHKFSAYMALAAAIAAALVGPETTIMLLVSPVLAAAVFVP